MYGDQHPTFALKHPNKGLQDQTVGGTLEQKSKEQVTKQCQQVKKEETTNYTNYNE